MAINKHHMGILILIGAVAILFGYSAYLRVDVQTYPDIEASLGGGINHPRGMMPTEYVQPGNHVGEVVNLPHRYPTVSGGNITALIHRGFSPLRKRAPRDSKWIECPPGEVMF